jgi:5'(3')-deoxyribonucleotidase
MRLLCDVDGVLANWIEPVLDVIEQASGRRITPHECKGWLKFNALGLDKTEQKYIDSVLKSPGFVEALPVLPGALDGLKQMAKLGCEIAYVTAPWNSATWMYERQAWLKKHGFKDVSNNTHFVATASKYLVSPGLLVDDKISNVLEYNSKSVGGRAVLWHTEWNAVDPSRKFVQVVSSWQQLYQEVEQYVKRSA